MAERLQSLLFGLAVVVLLTTGGHAQIQSYCPVGSTPQYSTGFSISLYPQSCTPGSYSTCSYGYSCQSAGYGYYTNQYYCCSTYTSGIYPQNIYGGGNYIQTAYSNQYCPIGTSDYIVGMAQTYGAGTTMCSVAGQFCAVGYTCQYGVSGGLYCCSTRYGYGIGKK